MSIPQVVIVGRPNVGKSSLFNWLSGKRLAIVDSTAGVTRDRMIHLLCVEDRYFELVDTGGMGFLDPDNLTRHIEEQIAIAVDAADVLLFIVDTRDGLTPLDAEIAARLRQLEKPLILVANKADHEKLDQQADEFYKLGQENVVRVSTIQNRNREELLDLIVASLPQASDEVQPVEPTMKVAIVGRRNTGKSTFVNTLAKSERMIVSEVPGTTRDSVDVRFELDGKAFIAIDTPGLKRGRSISTDLDFYSLHRAQRSIRRADVVLLFFDPMEKISKVDTQLCDYITEQFKPCIFVVNKWDLLAKEMPTEDWATYLRDTFRNMAHVPIAFITGQTGKNAKTLLNHAQMLFKQSLMRVATSELNRVMEAAIENNQPPLYRNRRPKIKYATQVGMQPPTIVLFCSDPQAVSPTYRRYLLGVLRDHLPFGEVPIKFYLRKRGDGAGKAAAPDEALLEDRPSPAE